jgi:dipeptidyl aminopeptidase/acylaminoacyl peptidase
MSAQNEQVHVAAGPSFSPYLRSETTLAGALLTRIRHGPDHRLRSRAPDRARRGWPAFRHFPMRGDPEDRAAYEGISPLKYIRAENAPLLMLQGKRDIRVPKDEAE